MKINSEMYVLFDDEVARMKLEFWKRRAFIHLLAKGSPLRVARRALRMFPAAKRICAALGIRVVEALFPDNAGLERLCVLCGFRLYARENGLTYMRCDNA